jgi:phosphoribosylaminoimidazole carboxylase (NCAIR synthetase)
MYIQFIECFLCVVRKNMSLFSNVNEEVKSFIQRHAAVTPPANAYICKKDQLEAKRHLNDANYTPKWQSVSQSIKSSHTCMYHGCTANTIDNTVIKQIEPR